jgi:hypothetical protein
VEAGLIGEIGGYAALGVYALTFIVSAIFAVRIFRNDAEDKLDRLLFDALLVTTAVMFLYPPLPQYVLLLLPFVLFAMISDRRYKTPLIILMIGMTIITLAGGPMNLVSVAAFSDLISLDWVMHAIEVCTAPFFGFESVSVIGFAGYILQYTAILLFLWVRFGEEIKERIARGRTKPASIP